MKNQLNRATAAMTAAVLGSIFTTAGVRASADEFTAGHTGANVALSQSNLTGKGVTVAVVDSGIYAHPDLNNGYQGQSRVLAAVNFAPDNITDDLCGHGTHVAGIVAGNGNCSWGNAYTRTFMGMAPNANLVSVRVLDASGQGTVSQVISGIQWAIANKAVYNIKVMNLSLGHPVGESYKTDPLCQAVEAAWKAGILVVCAAGNDGRLSPVQTAGAANEGWGTAYGSIQSPGNDPCVLTVGAMKEDLTTAAPGSVTGSRPSDHIATYSGRGPSRLDFVMKPDLVAPGNRVISLNAQNSYLNSAFSATNVLANSAYINTNNGLGKKPSQDYFYLSGTSMATPAVAGAAALVLQANPKLSPDAIKARLMISADKWADPSGNTDPCTYGAGYLNIPAALNCTAIPTMAALSPCLSQDAAGNVYVDANHIIWGTSVNGTQIIWGVNGVNNLQIIWGTHIIWGTSANILSASHIIWGTSVWGDHIIWGTASSDVDLSSTAVNGE